MLTTLFAAIQTFICTVLPPQAPEFNISLDPTSVCHQITPSPDRPILESVGKVIKQSQIEEDYRIKTVVIDPGHGGKDPGCLGSHHQEKHLALALGKKVALFIATQFPEVKVIMTRETDVFIPLHERTRIANQNNADLFISIHCNYMPGSRATSGSETYVMGLHTAEQNLEVAKRENNAILLEDNYQQNYDFDPNSPEAHIMLSMFQNAYLEQSILIAERVEEKIASFAGRRSRGVKQAGFYVLKATTMPSILIEAGFLSNREEENYLATEDGQNIVANAVFQAFAEYKSLVETGKMIQSSTPPPIVTNTPARPEAQPQVVRVNEQIPPTYPADTPSKMSNNSTVYTEPKIMPAEDNINRSPSGSPKSGTMIQFCVQLAASAKPVDASQNKWQGLRYQVEVVQEGNFYKYQARGFTDLEAALQAKNYLKTQGFSDAFLVAYKNGEKISVEDAKKELGIRY